MGKKGRHRVRERDGNGVCFGGRVGTGRTGKFGEGCLATAGCGAKDGAGTGVAEMEGAAESAAYGGCAEEGRRHYGSTMMTVVDVFDAGGYCVD